VVEWQSAWWGVVVWGGRCGWEGEIKHPASARGGGAAEGAG
jgi:hypothetical protein